MTGRLLFVRRRLRVAVIAGACLLALGAGGAPDALAAAAASDAATAPSPEITPAEQLVFTADHMHGVMPQTELDYAMAASGSEGQGADTIRVLVNSEGNAKGDAQVSDHTGPVALPTEGLPCNPIVIYFLERDISEMSALTGGQRRYFQKRLRLALAAGPNITAVTRRIDGKSVAVRQIVVQPYLHDPNAQRFARYTGKRYTFEIADALPGQVAQIRTEIPGPNGDFAHSVKTETLTFRAAVHKLTEPGSPPAAKPANTQRASR